MSWENLLQSEEEYVIAPWLGGRDVCMSERIFKIKGELPKEHGWYKFGLKSRSISLVGQSEAPFGWEDGRKTSDGYLIGDVFISDNINFKFDPKNLSLILKNGSRTYLIEPGLNRFARVKVVKDILGRTLFVREEFPIGPEFDVLASYQDKVEDLSLISNVIPSLDLCFQFETWYRADIERKREEAEAKRLEEERLAELRKTVGTAVGRRELAKVDFAAACKAALKISGADYLDHKNAYGRNEVAVQYRYLGRRLECTVDKYSLRIIDAGVCLDDHRGTKGDTYFTLESLPGVIKQAVDEGRLVVWRYG